MDRAFGVLVMFRRSRIFRLTPRCLLAPTTLFLALISGCHPTQGQGSFEGRLPFEGKEKGNPKSAPNLLTGDGAALLAQAEQLRRSPAQGNERAEELLSALRNEEPLIRGIALLSLLNESQANSPTLLAAGNDLDLQPWVRFVVLEQARKGRRPVPAEVCDWAFTGAEPAVRARAAAACVNSGSSTESVLLRLARDPEWQVRARLAAALARSEEQPGHAVVLKALAEDPHPTVCRAARRSGPAVSS